LKQEIRQQVLLLVKLASSDIATFISSLHKKSKQQLNLYTSIYIFSSFKSGPRGPERVADSHSKLEEQLFLSRYEV